MDLSFEKENQFYFKKHLNTINKIWHDILYNQELYLYDLNNYLEYDKYCTKLEKHYKSNKKGNKNQKTLKKHYDKLNIYYKKLNKHKYNRDNLIYKINSIYTGMLNTDWGHGAKKLKKTKRKQKKVKSMRK